MNKLRLISIVLFSLAVFVLAGCGTNEKAAKTYSVVFDPDGGAIVDVDPNDSTRTRTYRPAAQQVEEGGAAQNPVPANADFTRVGYTFDD